MELDLSRLTDCFAFVFGAGEFDVISAFERLAPRRAVVLDIGANVGSSSLAFAQRRPDARILAVEPSAEMRQALQRNLELNSLANVEVVPLAFSRQRGTGALMVLSAGNPGSAYLTSTPTEERTEPIAVERLDDWWPAGARVDFVKMDVEGSETAILEGGERTIRESRPVIVLEVNDEALERQGSSRSDLLNCLLEMEYKPYVQAVGGFARYDPSRFGRYDIHNLVTLPGEKAPVPLQLSAPGRV